MNNNNIIIPLAVAVVISCLLLSTIGQCATLNDTETLFNDFIAKNNHRFRPIKNQSNPIEVRVVFNLLFLEDIDVVKETVCLNILVILLWTDEVRTWNPSDYGGLTRLVPDPSDIWKPRLYLANSVRERDMFENDFAPLTISASGETSWSPGGVYVVSCPMKMTYFPFDSQTCSMLVVPHNVEEEISLVDPFVGMSDLHQDGEWDLIETWTTIVHIDGSNHQIVVFNMRFRRRYAFVVLNLVLPIVLLSALSPLVFLVPVEGGERVSLSMTVLLSLAVYMSQVSSVLPRNSTSLPFLIVYLICLFLHCIAVLVANCVVLLQYHSQQSSSSSSSSRHHNGQQPPLPQENSRTRDTNNCFPQSNNYHPNLHHQTTTTDDDYEEEDNNSLLKSHNHQRFYLYSPKILPASNYDPNTSYSESSSANKSRRPQPTTMSEFDGLRPTTSSSGVYLDDVIRRVTNRLFPRRLTRACLVSVLPGDVRPVDAFLFYASYLLWTAATLVFIVVINIGKD